MPRTPEKPVYFVRRGPQERLAEYLEKFGRRLFNSGIHVDRTGHIFYTTSSSLRPETPLSDYKQVSLLSPQVDIDAPYTQYSLKRQRFIHEVKTEGGRVEAAIRNMDHILEDEFGKETARAKLVGRKASELFDLYGKSFAQITPGEFEEAREKTIRELRLVRLDPETVLDQTIREMSGYLIKGSFGHDAAGRENMLIALGALLRAHRLAVQRYYGIGEITGKFAAMREALLLAREFDRAMLTEVAKRFAPTHLPALAMFRHPDKSARDLPFVTGALTTVRFQLTQTRVLPYRGIALGVLPIAERIQQLLSKDQRAAIRAEQLFDLAYTPIAKVLADPKSVYPREAD